MSAIEFDSLVMMGFLIVALTGPASGVIIGGICVDRLGGFEGVASRIVIFKFLLGCALAATICGVTASLN